MSSQENARTSQRPRLAYAAGLLAVATTASKAVGLLRDIIIGQIYGTTVVNDAYQFANNFTGNFFVLFGGMNGPFDSCTFNVLCTKSRKQQSIILRRILRAALLWTAPLAFCLFIAAPYLAPLLASFYDSRHALAAADRADLCARLSQELTTQIEIMSPILVLTGVVGILTGVARVRNRTTIASLSPAIGSLTIIASVLIAKHGYGIASGWPLALGTTFGCLAQLVFQVPSAFVRLPSELMNSDDENADEAIGRYRKMVGPAAIGTTIGQLTGYVDMLFGLSLQPGAWTAVTYSTRLFQFPMGVLNSSLQVPLFERFTHAARNDQKEELASELHRGLRFLWFVTLPVIAVLMSLVDPLVRLVFEGGKFDERSVSLVSTVLFFLVPSMFFYVGRDLLMRVFIATSDTITTSRVSILALIMNALFDWLFVFPLNMGVAGISLSSSCVTTISFSVLLLILRNRIHMRLRRLIVPVSCMSLAAAVCGLTASQSLKIIVPILGASKLALAADIGISALCGFATYAFASWLMRLQELNLILQPARAILFRNK